MIFILLKEHVNCSDFVEKLTVQDFYLKFLKNTPVHVYWSKFKQAYQLAEMKRTRMNMGLGSIFEQGIFMGLKKPATLVERTHKSIIFVDEKGSDVVAV